MPKNATVAITTPVVDTTSSRLGQVTCFISTRTSCRNSRVPSILPVTLRASSLPFDSSFALLTACVAITSFHPHEPRGPCPHRILAGEEGFEPPYPVLETGVLTVGRLPLTLSPDQLKLLFPAPTLDLPSCDSALRTSSAPLQTVPPLPLRPPPSATWPLCAACASGTHGKTSSSPCAPNASSCSSWWCNSGSCTHHTAA